MFAGMDWGGSFHQLCVLETRREVLLQQRITHDVAGLDELTGCSTCRARARCVVAIERAEGLLVEFLQTLPAVDGVLRVAEDLGPGPGAVSVVGGRSRTRFDAFVLADTLRHEHRRWRPLSRPVAVAGRAAGGVAGPATGCCTPSRPASRGCGRCWRPTIPAPLHLFSELDRDITLDVHPRLSHP